MIQPTLMMSLKQAVLTLKSKGLKEGWRVYRWKLVLAIFVYYLIRDTFIYLVLPALAVHLLK